MPVPRFQPTTFRFESDNISLCATEVVHMLLLLLICVKRGKQIYGSLNIPAFPSQEIQKNAISEN